VITRAEDIRGEIRKADEASIRIDLDSSVDTIRSIAKDAAES
jgi:hypothetical protein